MSEPVRTTKLLALPAALRLSVGTESRYTTNLWYVHRTSLFRRRTHTTRTTWERGTVLCVHYYRRWFIPSTAYREVYLFVVGSFLFD